MLKARFDFLRYANCWEDIDYLIHQSSPLCGGRYLSIASAGDNTLALLSRKPELLVAADLNPVQLFLLELKMALFRELEYEEMRNFLLVPGQNQPKTYPLIRSGLSSGAMAYWDQNLHLMENGILYQGKFERYFRYFRTGILPLIHTRQRIDELFVNKTGREQEWFYRTRWNNLRWKWLFHLFFSRFVMGRFGRDPEFLRQVEVSVGTFLYERAGSHLQTTESQQNYFLRFILQGQWDSPFPFYLRKEHFTTIREGLENLKIQLGPVEDVARRYNRFDFANLSNIFEYMATDQLKQFEPVLGECLNPGARLAYWNLMVPRNLSGLFPEKYQALPLDPEKTDLCFFYRQFVLEEKR